MADIADTTLRRLSALGPEFSELVDQLRLLAKWAADHDLHLAPSMPTPPAAFLEDTAAWLKVSYWGIFHLCSEIVEDIAQTLPLRDVDYGTA